MKIKIIHQDYTIAFQPEPKLADGTRCAGFTDTENGRIVVAENLKPDNQREVLLHELIHAVDDTLSIGLKEKEVHQLSVGLYTVLKENPNLRKFLFGGK